MLKALEPKDFMYEDSTRYDFNYNNTLNN